MDQAVLIFAPLGRDATLMAQVLGNAGIDPSICRDADEMFAGIAGGAGAVLLTEEALETRTLARLSAALAAQPTWSSLPLVVLRGEHRGGRKPGGPDAAAQHLGVHQGVIQLQRPLPVVTMVSIVQSVLAARRRQYQVRDLLAQLESSNQHLEARVTERTAVAHQRAEQLRALSGELLLAEEREQRRFAELLHDDLQQILMAASLNAQVLLRAKNPAQKDELARDIVDLLDRSVQATRSLTVELSAPVLYERGLAAALEWLAAEIGRQHRLEIAVHASTADDPAVADLRVFCFRAVRELLLNAVKYGQGSAVRITMDHDEKADALRIMVADEGPGFDPAALATRDFGSGGFGLANIRHRAALLGGELCIDSAPGCGTRMTLLAPLLAPHQEAVTEKALSESSDTASGAPLPAKRKRKPASAS